MKKTIWNKSLKPLRINLHGGHVLHLGPNKTGQIAEEGLEVFSLGATDTLLVSTPDDKGDYVLLEVGLRQLTVSDAGKTARYDSIFKGEHFELVPARGGGSGVEGEILSRKFDGGKAEVDLAGADTSSYKALFPNEPTQLDTEKSFGSLTGKARWK